MRVVYTDEALRDLDGILGFIAEHYPMLMIPFENRLGAAMRRIWAWPQSAPEVVKRPGVRMLPLIPYPYKLFYRVMADRVEILHLHHASRREPWRDEAVLVEDRARTRPKPMRRHFIGTVSQATKRGVERIF